MKKKTGTTSSKI